MFNKIKNTIYSLLFKETVVIHGDDTLAGKTVMITGGTKGIGLSTAEVLIAKGANVAVLSRTSAQAATRLMKNQNALYIQCDITDQKNCKRAVSSVIKKFGNIDVLFNNAGTYTSTTKADYKESDTNAMIDTNIKGMIAMCMETIPHMKRARNGLIINMGSYISRNPVIEHGRSAYAATKYAVEGYSRALSQELSADNIRVTCLMPGTVKTFRTVTPNKYMSPYRVADVVAFLIHQTNIHVESMSFRAVV